MPLRAWLACILLLAALPPLSGCDSLPAADRPHSAALLATADTRLGRTLAPAMAAHPGLSGATMLASGRDAFAARVLLARAADRTLDVQYYIWHADVTGNLLAAELWRAAERGVRVRLLLDDNNTRGLDETLAALDAHPNIEVRLFNPYANRGLRIAELAVDFDRLNRRMHNKSFTADSQLTIVGGRNVGDEYFGAGGAVDFADLDVLTAGPVVPEVSRDFDAYWNSAAAYPAASLIRKRPPDPAAMWKAVAEAPGAARYLEVVRTTPLVRQLVEGTVPFEWSRAHLVSDDPHKVMQSHERQAPNLLQRLESMLGKPLRELDLVSSYFVPTEDGSDSLRALVARGVKVRVLTNSLAATDVAAVHAGYSKYRRELLRAGVRLYELKPAQDGDRGGGSGSGSILGGSEGGRGYGGSSDASLHAKTFAVDRARIFVGSFNFDPRSVHLNTEMGVVLDNPVFASRLARQFEDEIPRKAYEVRLAADGSSLEWVERTQEGEVRHATEPQASLWRRAWVGFLSLLPIEWLL
ncbi:MAG TPA: phospholipase D family protein [Myxococcota bacterium]|nr:phospholipase D family protein [Myxococcota bacterium]